MCCVSAKMTVNVPWSTLRHNPRDQRERAAATNGFPAGAEGGNKDGETEIAWDVTDFGKRMAFGGIVSNAHMRRRQQRRKETMVLL